MHTRVGGWGVGRERKDRDRGRDRLRFRPTESMPVSCASDSVQRTVSTSWSWNPSVCHRSLTLDSQHPQSQSSTCGLISIRHYNQGPGSPENSNSKPTLYSQLASQPQTLESPEVQEPLSQQLGPLPKHGSPTLGGQQSQRVPTSEMFPPLGSRQTMGKRDLMLIWNEGKNPNISGQDKSSRNRHPLYFQTLSSRITAGW